MMLLLRIFWRNVRNRIAEWRERRVQRARGVPLDEQIKRLTGG